MTGHSNGREDTERADRRGDGLSAWQCASGVVGRSLKSNSQDLWIGVSRGLLVAS